MTVRWLEVWGAMALAIAFFMSGPVAADPARDFALCVQKQLADLGANPGPLDGHVGPKTRGAARALQTEHPARVLVAELPPLTRRTAIVWCRELARLSRGAAGRHLPAAQGFEVRTDPSRGDAAKVLLEETLHRALSFYRQQGVKVVSTLGVAGARSSEDLLKLARDLDSVSPTRLFALERWTESACDRRAGVSGVAFNSEIFLCWPASGSENAAWATVMERQIARIIIHEMMHIIQQELSLEVVPEPQRARLWGNLGPEWLVEGAAEIFAHAYLERRRKSPNDDLEVFFHASGRSEANLADLRAPRSVPTNRGYTVSTLAVKVLVERSGKPALFDYWRRIGEGQSVQSAFENTFGLSLSEFERIFTQNRRNLAALERFAAGIQD